MSHIYTRSIIPKIPSFQEYIMSRDSDLCVITEMWLKGVDEMAHKSIPPNGYKIISHPRTNGRNSGGIAPIYKEFLKVNEEREMQNNQMMECSRFKIKLDSHDMVKLYAIYRNPASNVIAFCEELATILKKNILVDRGTLLLMGDFNVHIDNSSHADTNIFNDFMDSFNLQNHINFPPHFAQHTLNLFIDDKDNSHIGLVIRGHQLPDHSFIHCNLSTGKQTKHETEITHRKLKHVDPMSFGKDIEESLNHLVMDGAPSTDLAVKDYIQIPNMLLDKHTPLNKITSSLES